MLCEGTGEISLYIVCCFIIFYYTCLYTQSAMICQTEWDTHKTNCYNGTMMILIDLITCKQVPEFIDSVFTQTSPKRSFLIIKNERFGLVFANTGSINSGKGPTSLFYCICIVHVVLLYSPPHPARNGLPNNLL